MCCCATCCSNLVRLQDEQRNWKPSATCSARKRSLADQWYLDDGDILCHPLLVLPIYKCSTQPTLKLEQKSSTASQTWVQLTLPEWRINDVRPPASVSAAAHGHVTLEIAVGPRQCAADHLLVKADIIRAMCVRVQLCQDPHTEFAIFCESRGVSRIKYILRVHGHTILQEKEDAKIFEVGQRSLERFFPGYSEDSSEQATLSTSQSGIGYKRARDFARPAHLGALIAATPRILDMVRGAATAGLLPGQPLLARPDTLIETATPALLDALTTQRNPQLGCTCKKKPKLQLMRGSKRYKDTVAQPSRYQQSQKLNRVPSPPGTMTTTSNPHLPHPEKAVSAQHSSKRSSPCCLTEPDCDACNTLCIPKERGSK